MHKKYQACPWANSKLQLLRSLLMHPALRYPLPPWTPPRNGVRPQISLVVRVSVPEYAYASVQQTQCMSTLHSTRRSSNAARFLGPQAASG
jgi:hypothetical protein